MFVSNNNEQHIMKKLVYIVSIIIFTASFVSCGTASHAVKNDADVAGYTLKNKKELMQQKILNNKSKTIIATP
jgi:hypothetical protein